MCSRKIKAFVLIITMLIASVITVNATEIKSPVMSGDLDSNSSVDSIDLFYMQKHLLGYDVNINLFAADMDGDSEITAVDLLYLKKYLLGYSVVVAKTVKITFNSNGGSEIASAITNIGLGLEELPVPILDGKTFSGWYAGDVLINEDTIFSSDTTITAQWK